MLPRRLSSCSARSLFREPACRSPTSPGAPASRARRRSVRWDPSIYTAPPRRRMEDEVKRAVLGLVVAAYLLPAALAAQAVTGTILGVITDSTGGGLPRVFATLTHPAPRLGRAAATDSKG